MTTFLRFRKLKNKLLLSFAAFTFIAIVIAGVASFIIYRIRAFNALHQNATAIHVYGQEIQNATLRFLLEDVSNEAFIRTGQSANIDTIDHKLQAIEALLEEQHYQHLGTFAEIKEQSSHISTLLHNYQRTFNMLKGKIQQRGFKNEGLEGRMREAVHSLQAKDLQLDLATVLMMRRHEKDFFLRKDLSYTSKLQETALDLLQQVDSNNALKQEEKQALRKVVDLYVNNFLKIVEIEKEIGLEDHQGLKGALSNDMKKLNLALLKTEQMIERDCENLTNLSVVLFSFICMLAIGIGLFLSMYISRAISKPIVLLTQAARAVEQGHTDLNFYLDQITQRDETGQLAESFKAMYHKLDQIIKTESEKAEELKKLAEENQKRSWINEGLNKFSELQRTYAQDMEGLCAKVLAELIHYIEANQGVIFLAKEDQEGKTHLSLTACYAYSKKRFVEKIVYPGQGLVGQCYLEKEPVILTEIPTNYVSITSGLGEATPRFLLLVPMIYNDEVTGVLELAAFQPLAAHQIEFINRVAASLAGAIATMKINEQTKALLHVLKKQDGRLLLAEDAFSYA